MDLAIIDRYRDRDAFVEDLEKRTYTTEIACHGCSQVIVQTFLDVFGEDNPAVSMASSPFAAGMALTGNTCGALIGGLMVLGMVFGRRDVHEGMEGILAGIKPLRRMIRTFEEKRGGKIACREITGTDLADPKKAEAYFGSGGLERCARMMAEVSGYVGRVLYEERAKQREEEKGGDA